MADNNNRKSSGSLTQRLKDAWDWFTHIFDLREGTDKQGTIDSIVKYIQIKGYNVWILISAAMIAAIGLDNNAPAIIIGAMLISPLMSPILGIGLAIGINDRETLWLSIQNFFIAITVSILTSLLYFSLTPLGSPTHELLSRTQPTLLDALVALFGGIAGIVAGSRSDKTNAIPGVAIATALMPPLCTVGYGLAKGNPAIWGGALYLFFINAVIIAFTTYLVVRYLKFPLKEYVNPSDKRKTTFYIGAFVSLMLIPSIFILFNTLNRIARDNNVKNFVATEINSEKREALQWKFNDLDTIAELKIYLVGESFPMDTIPTLEATLQKYPNLENAELELIQVDVSQEEKERMTSEITDEVNKVVFEVQSQLQEQKTELAKIVNLQNKIRKPAIDSLEFQVLQKELKAMYPELNRLGASRMLETDFAMPNDTVYLDSLNRDSIRLVPQPNKAVMKMVNIISINWKPEADSTRLQDYEKRVASYIKVRLKYNEDFRLVRY